MKLKKLMGILMVSALAASSLTACGDKETNTEPSITPTDAPVDTPTPTEAPVDTPTPTEAPVDTPTPTEAPVEDPVDSNVIYSFDASARSQALYFQDRGNGCAKWYKDGGHDSDECFLVTNRSANWHGTSLSVDDQYIGKVLHVSYYAKHDNPEPITISCTLQVNKPDGSSDWPERANNESVPAGEWILIEGDIPIYPDASSPMIYWEATDTCEFYIDDVVVSVVEGAAAEAHYADLVVDVPVTLDVDSISLTFDDENLFFKQRGDGVPAIVSGGQDDDFCMEVTGRTSNWHGAEVDLTTYGLAGRTVNLSFYAKSDEAVEVKATMQEASAAGTTYSGVASTGTLTPGEWTYVTGSIVVGEGTTTPTLYFEADSDTAGFQIDVVTISFEGETAGGNGGEGNENDGEAAGGPNEIVGAAVEAGAVVYYNSFENEKGYYLDGSNSYNYATNENVVGLAHNGNESVLVKSREADTAGCGLRISAANGLSITDLTGHTVEFSVWVYFEDGAYSTAPDTLNFTIWNRQKKVDTDADGQAVYEIALEQEVKKGEWALLSATMELVDGTDGGMLLIGTQGETSETGYLSSYYMDEMKLTVVE